MKHGALLSACFVALSLVFLSSLPRSVMLNGLVIGRLAIVEPIGLKQQLCQDFLKGDPLVVLVLGQSNAGNHGVLEHDFGSRKISLVYGNHCFFAPDPLPGATGRGGSVWTRLGKLLEPQQILFSVLAVESTAIEDWVNPGLLNWELRQKLRTLRYLGIKIDLIVWQQGEADARRGTSRGAYKEDFLRLLSFLRKMGFHSPVMFALSTHCRFGDGSHVRSALVEIAAQRGDVWVGPDTDQLLGDHRRDDCHFSGKGLDQAALLWATAINSRLPEISAAR